MPLDIDKNTNRLLNVFVVPMTDPVITPQLKLEHQLFKNAKVFASRSDVFRFDVSARGDGPGALQTRSLRVELGEAWDDIRVTPL
jgi:hypothetical protein